MTWFHVAFCREGNRLADRLDQRVEGFVRGRPNRGDVQLWTERRPLRAIKDRDSVQAAARIRIACWRALELDSASHFDCHNLHSFSSIDGTGSIDTSHCS